MMIYKRLSSLCNDLWDHKSSCHHKSTLTAGQRETTVWAITLSIIHWTKWCPGTPAVLTIFSLNVYGKPTYNWKAIYLFQLCSCVQPPIPVLSAAFFSSWWKDTSIVRNVYYWWLFCSHDLLVDPFGPLLPSSISMTWTLWSVWIPNQLAWY